MQAKMIASEVCAVVLAGGRGQRMGGSDKGLQPFRGQPLAWHALERLRAQTFGAPGRLLINANRNLDTYRQWGAEVCSDTIDGFAGPLAGVLAALAQCRTSHPYLLTVPCDSPRFPLDLLERLAHALQAQDADIAMVVAPDSEETASPEPQRLRRQPVFCLYKTHLADSLGAFMATGQRKIDAWTSQHTFAEVPFDLPADDPRAFANANTLAELANLESP